MICQLIQNLINYGISNELIAQDDSIFVRNQLMHELQISEWKEPQSLPEMSLEEILDGLLSYACEQGIIIDSSASRDLLDTKLTPGRQQTGIINSAETQIMFVQVE